MIQFQIKLLTPVFLTNSQVGISNFLETTVSNFILPDQQGPFDPAAEDLEKEQQFSKSNFSYTFDEQISIHKNAQKDLSFSMLQYQWNDDVYEKNPFVSKIKVGSQLLLIDTYGNEYFFSVKNISYDIKKDNIVYKYDCQDSFTFNLIRQQSGYTIENDLNSESFIGARSIDWWAEKIKKECYIPYQYVKLDEGLYIDNNDNLTKTRPAQVKYVIKEPFSKNEDKELFESLPFSLSDSNASAALISLGETLGLTLKTAERNRHTSGRTTSFNQYFWFEPEKNNKPSGLRYSPYREVQSFSLSHAGDSLTTILNIEPNTINDEVITVFDKVPLFFSQLIQNTKEWNDSSFKTGYFSQKCRGEFLRASGGVGEFSYSQVFSQWTGTLPLNTSLFTSSALYIHLPHFFIPYFYDRVDFSGSSFMVQVQSTEDVLHNKIFSPNTRLWELCFITATDSTSYHEQTFNSRDTLPESVKGKIHNNLYIKIHCSNTRSEFSISQDEICISFSRVPSKEDLEFAALADKCPWLENKLIDFSYFLKQKLITPLEYSALMNEFTNELRKINGRLLMYTSNYYNAIHQKTKILADLESTLDRLGANFSSEVVDDYSEHGSIKDPENFKKEYDAYLAKYNNNEPIQIYNLPSLLTEYSNKYLKAQQRFLKNMYEFRKYFESNSGWGNAVLYRDTITLDHTNYQNYLTFEPNNWKVVNNSFTHYNSEGGVTTPIYDNSLKRTIKIVDRNNYMNFYVPQVHIGDLVNCNTTDVFDPKLKYYKGTDSFSRVYFPEMAKTFLEAEATKTDAVNYYYQDKNTQTSIDWFESLDSHLLNLDASVWYALFTEADEDNKTWDPIASAVGGTGSLNDKSSLLWQFYREHFPVESIQIQEPNYTYNSNLLAGASYYPAALSKYIQDWKSYKEASRTTNPIDLGASPFDQSSWKTYNIPIVTPTNESKYYRRVVAHPGWGGFVATLATIVSVGDISWNTTAHSIWSSGKDKWATKGLGVNDFEGNPIGTNISYRNYFDVGKIIYAPKESSYTEYWDINYKNQKVITAIKEETEEGYVKIATSKDGDSHLYGKVEWINQSTPGSLLKQYFNYFSKIVPTYLGIVGQNGFKDGRVTYTNGWLRPVEANERVFKNRKYRILRNTCTNDISNKTEAFLFKNDNDFESFIASVVNSSEHRFSKIKYYPIYNVAGKIDFSILEKEDENAKSEDGEYIFTLEYVLDKLYPGVEIHTKNTEDYEGDYIFINNVDGSDNTFIICEEEDFVFKPVVEIEETDEEEKVINHYTSQTIYNGDRSEFKIHSTPGVVSGYKYLSTSTEDFQAATSYDESDDYYYKKEDDSFEQAFTLQQVKQASRFYYQSGSKKEIESLDPTKTSFKAKVFCHKVTMKTNNNNQQEIEKEEVFELENYVEFKYSDNKVKEEELNDKDVHVLEVEHQGVVYKTNYTFSGTEIENLGSMNKGTFWYRYHNYLEQPALNEEAAIIETQLSTYWNEAYSASLLCEYFLPSTWQPNLSGKSNSFIPWILGEIETINSDNSRQKNEVILLERLVPRVGVSLEVDTLYNFIHKDTLEEGVDDDEENLINISTDSPYNQILENLGDSSANYYITPSVKGSFYQRIAGGTTWTGLISDVAGKYGKFELMSGQYLMIYKTLNNYFVSMSFKTYFNTLKEKEDLWRRLYIQYPNILLEDSYKNEDATTGAELLQMAEYAFRDKMNPEQSYQIAYINADLLDGYDKTELKIGDGIRVDAEEYYEERDDIFNSLSQFLFITDISYKLRDSANIQLTVNNIKYQEKLIQRLVKLIK